MSSEPTLDPSRITQSPRHSGETRETVDASAATQRIDPGELAKKFPVVAGYEITSEIARGGMGRVLAGREIALDREVAIKVLLPGADAQRFVTESRITARLPHPSIPPVYALGTLADGSPYLAMKRIHGQTLESALRARPDLNHEQTRYVQVFEQVCHAVGFAHASSVVHRDLKPSNVMVGAFGEVQVMDWGLAKVLGSDVAEAAEAGPVASRAPGPDLRPDKRDQWTDSSATRTGSVLGTPAYMAPEQARGEAVDARADVFALGGILTTILTGRAVFGGDSAAASIQQAAAGEVGDVLRRLDACAADPELIGIAKLCLWPDRARRPADGRAVAAAVAAYRQGVEERLRRAELERTAAEAKADEQRKRRRVVLGAAAAIAAVLALGMIGTTWGLYEARQQASVAQAEARAKDEARQREADQRLEAELHAQRAEQSFKLSRQTIERFSTMLTNNELMRKPGLEPIIKDVRLLGVEYHRRLLEQRPQDPEATDNLALALFFLAMTNEDMGAIPEAQANYEEAAELLESLVARQVNRPGVRIRLAAAYGNLHYLHLGAGRRELAIECLTRTASLHHELLEANPKNLNVQRDWAITCFNLGTLQLDDDPDQALKRYETARDALRGLVGSAADELNLRFNLVDTMIAIGTLHLNQNRLHEATQAFHAAREQAIHEVAQYPEQPTLKSLLGKCWNGIAQLAESDGRHDDAVAAWNACLAIQREAVDSAKEVVVFRQRLADHSMNLADLQRKLGALQHALTLLHEARGAAAHDPTRLFRVACGFSQCVPLTSATPRDADTDQKPPADLAIETLAQAIDAGFAEFDRLESEPDLEPLRKHPRFRSLIPPGGK